MIHRAFISDAPLQGHALGEVLRGQLLGSATLIAPAMERRHPLSSVLNQRNYTLIGNCGN